MQPGSPGNPVSPWEKEAARLESLSRDLNSVHPNPTQEGQEPSALKGITFLLFCVSLSPPPLPSLPFFPLPFLGKLCLMACLSSTMESVVPPCACISLHYNIMILKMAGKESHHTTELTWEVYWKRREKGQRREQRPNCCKTTGERPWGGGESQRPHGGRETSTPWRQSLSEVFIEIRVKGREEEEEARTSLSYDLGLGRKHHLTLTPRKTHHGNCACALGAAPGFVSSHLRR